jgi:hypothetical protein
METCKKFNREDVTDEMLAPVPDVRARNTDSDMKRHIHVEHVVILPRGKKEGAVQPTKIDAWDFEVSNLAGATFTRKGKAAAFNLTEPPAGELDIVVVTERYEQRAGIDKKDRAKLNAWSGVLTASATK